MTFKKVNKGRIFPQPSFFCAQMWVVGRYFYIILNKPLGLFWYWVTSHVCDFGCHKKASVNRCFVAGKEQLLCYQTSYYQTPPEKKSYLKQISLYLVSEIHSGQEFKCVFFLLNNMPSIFSLWQSAYSRSGMTFLTCWGRINYFRHVLGFCSIHFFSISIVIKTFQ